MKKQFEYIAREPEGDQKPEQLVVLIHGYGLNASAMEKMADEIAVKLPRALIIMPHAPEEFTLPDEDNHILRVPQQLHGNEDANESGRQWFPIEGKDFLDYKPALIKVAADLNEMINDFLQENGLRESNAAIMGFSQGGAVALYTALTRDKPLGALVAHSTVFIDDGKTKFNRDTPSLFIHGEDDEEFSQDLYKQVIKALSRVSKSLDVITIQDLKHKTSHESRAHAAAFIHKKLV